jgi:hypothetical protein
MSELQQLQFPVDRAIYAEVLACLPGTWNRATLRASSEEAAPGDVRMAVRIDGMGQPGIALVSDALQDRVRELFLLNQRFRTGLRGIVYTYQQRSDGRWSFLADYDYA